MIIFPMITNTVGGGITERGGKIILFLYFLLILFLIGVVLEVSGVKPVTKLLIKSDKNYTLPAPYKLVHNDFNGKYIIAKQGSVTEYMDVDLRRYNFWYNIQYATTFNDSAKAKGALKYYININQFK